MVRDIEAGLLAADADGAEMENLAPERLQRAVARNHVSWLSDVAWAAGGEVYSGEEVTWTYDPAADGGAVAILFPELSEESAGAQLDQILSDARQLPALSQISCWSLLPAKPHDLGVRLLARGFETGWQPHWMWLDFRHLNTDFATPAGLAVELVAGPAVSWQVEDLPYYSAEVGRRLHDLSEMTPGRVWHFAARLEDRVVGHSVLYRTLGPHVLAGIYNCGVVPGARNRGIGKAVTLAACQFARDLGGPGAVLNATPLGEPVYRALGFQSIGYGQTWWMHREALSVAPPSAGEIGFAEAVGRADLAVLDRSGAARTPEALDAALPNGLTPLQLAVQAAQPAAASWLVEHGATLDVISGWDLGWKDRVRTELATTPELANLRLGRLRLTPLHEAVQRDDRELAGILLAAHPDLEARDAQYHSTPLGWAQALHRTELAELIRQKVHVNAPQIGSALSAASII